MDSARWEYVAIRAMRLGRAITRALVWFPALMGRRAWAAEKAAMADAEALEALMRWDASGELYAPRSEREE